MKNIVILGAGTAGTMTANKLVKELNMKEWNVTVIDRDDVHVYQPGLLFLPFGTYKESDILRPRHKFVGEDVDYVQGQIDRVDPKEQKVYVQGQGTLDYDILVVATGTRITPEATEGLTGPLWNKDIFDFYTYEGAAALADKLDRFEGGRMVLNVVDMPIKCPVAPLEFLCLADDYFHRRGIRDKVEIVYATPLDGAFTKPVSSAVLGGLLERKNIKVEPNFNLEKVNNDDRTLDSYDGRQVDFDLLVSVPLHAGAEAIEKSGLGDDFGFVPTHKHTLQSTNHPNIFAIGDGTNLPTSKAGAVAHFQAEVLVPNILRYIEEKPLLETFDGHANCFIETGFDKAMLIDFNYDTEPLPGHYPLPGVGPFSLLKETTVNHMGKLAFKWIYWNMLLPGDELPVDHKMLMAGKWSG